MIFTDTGLAGAWLIEPSPVVDERGFFARMFCAETFAAKGMETAVQQCSVSFNSRRATLRGMHYQIDPGAEVKLVRCTGGAIFDVIVDLRAESPTHCRWFGAELSADNRKAFYIPRGFAHGFITLTDSAEVFYQISDVYRPELARGVRWDDPAFGIDWPFKPEVISERDRDYADYRP